MINPQYQQITLDFIRQDEDASVSQTRTVIADDAAGDLVHVLTNITNFLRAAGFDYVGQIAVFNVGNDSDEPDHYGENLS